MATFNPISPRRLRDERRQSQSGVFSKDHFLSVDSDIVLVTSDDSSLHVHKLMLSLWSHVFRDLLSTTQEHSLLLSDSSQDMLLLLGQMYPGPARKPIRETNVERLMRLGDKFDCPDVIVACEQYLLEVALPAMERSGSRDPAAIEHMRTRSFEWMSMAQSYHLAKLEAKCAELLGSKFTSWGLQAHLEDLQQYVDYKGLVQIMANIKTAPAEAGQAAQQQQQQQQAQAGFGPAAGPAGQARRRIPVTMAAAMADPLVPMHALMVPGGGVVEPLLF